MGALFRLARLLLQRNWQATYHAAKAPEGLTLLFPMNELFEKSISVLLRRTLARSAIEVIDQGGHRACLGVFTGDYRHQVEEAQPRSARPQARGEPG
ncbi:MAG: hypothetical protein U0975_04600 [Erythrobacter sp.]|nr:hypothetical protein [Erythrobacter sp.]MDZ4271932.1 hypothetical protein [Erythrobacter sp.]